MLSIFDIFKVGVGPSSSHTNGPMVAAADFADQLSSLPRVHRIQVELFGSLALTGKGHHTDRAVILGLQGLRPDTLDKASAQQAWLRAQEQHELVLPHQGSVSFSYQSDLLFDGHALPLHENGMRFRAFNEKMLCSMSMLPIQLVAVLLFPSKRCLTQYRG